MVDEKLLMDIVLKEELYEALHKARDLGIITEDTLSYYWAYQKEGMRWLNETPDWVEQADDKDYGYRMGDDIDFNGYQYEER